MELHYLYIYIYIYIYNILHNYIFRYDNDVREKIGQQYGFTHDLLSYFGHVKIKFFVAGLQRKIITKRKQFERFYLEAKDLMAR